jgi:hypothetical protein
MRRMRRKVRFFDLNRYKLNYDVPWEHYFYRLWIETNDRLNVFIKA